MTSSWARWRLKLPAPSLFTQPFIQAQIKQNIKASRHWPLCVEFTGDRWIPAQMTNNTETVSIWWRHHGLKFHAATRCSMFIYSLRTQPNCGVFLPSWLSTDVPVHRGTPNWAGILTSDYDSTTGIMDTSKATNHMKWFINPFSVYLYGDRRLLSQVIPPITKMLGPVYILYVHYNDVIMGAVASQITNLTTVYLTVLASADQRMLRVTGLCAGNSPVTSEFPAQMVNYSEYVSIWWRHHDIFYMLIALRCKKYSRRSCLVYCRCLMPVTLVYIHTSGLHRWRRGNNIEELVHDSSISSALAKEVMQSCTKPSIWLSNDNIDEWGKGLTLWAAHMCTNNNISNTYIIYDVHIKNT